MIVILVIIQSLLGHFGSRTRDVWEWLLPTTVPTSGMILSGLVYTAFDHPRTKMRVRRSFYVVALSLILFYQLAIWLTLLLPPFTDANPIDLMHTSNLWLGPIQGLAGAALGALFVSKGNEDYLRNS
jgi:hypothetical protein